MIVFSYQDYLACKKIIGSYWYLNENSSDYYLGTNSAVHNVHDAMYRALLNDKNELCAFLEKFINYNIYSNEILDTLMLFINLKMNPYIFLLNINHILITVFLIEFLIIILKS